jgi:hypothetical protein
MLRVGVFNRRGELRVLPAAAEGLDFCRRRTFFKTVDSRESSKGSIPTGPPLAWIGCETTPRPRSSIRTLADPIFK